jgi:hypothetical protein
LAISRPRTDDGGREHALVGIALNDVQRVPSIRLKLDPFMLDLGFDRTDPLALLHDARGQVIELRADEFED